MSEFKPNLLDIVIIDIAILAHELKTSVFFFFFGYFDQTGNLFSLFTKNLAP